VRGRTGGGARVVRARVACVCVCCVGSVAALVAEGEDNKGPTDRLLEPHRPSTTQGRPDSKPEGCRLSCKSTLICAHNHDAPYSYTHKPHHALRRLGRHAAPLNLPARLGFLLTLHVAEPNARPPAPRAPTRLATDPHLSPRCSRQYERPPVSVLLREPVPEARASLA